MLDVRHKFLVLDLTPVICGMWLVRNEINLYFSEFVQEWAGVSDTVNEN